MAYLPLRSVAIPDATSAAYDAWLAGIDGELSRPDCDRRELCRRVLTDIYFPGLEQDGTSGLTETERIMLLQMDPGNVTVEPEHYSDTDPDRYAPVKPLLWLWEMFDRSVLGENVHLGVLFRRILARRIFRSCGRDFKAFHQVKFSFGYNMDVGDGVVVHRHVLLDDRGGIHLDDGASVSDYVNIYSHTHDIIDPREISTPQTVIGRGVRIAYHATILSGITLGHDSMIGAGALVTKDTDESTINVGIPAKRVRVKPDGERRPSPPDPLAGRFNG